MAVNFANLEAVLQEKINALTAANDEKSLLLLAKAIEASIGSANVALVQAEGDAQIGRVIGEGDAQVSNLQQLIASLATQAYVQAQISSAITGLVNGAPGALDTLLELSTALGNDANFGATVTNALAGKLDKVGGTMAGPLTLGGEFNGAGHPYKNVHSKVIDLQNVSGAVTIDVSLGNDFRIVLTGATTVNFNGFPSAGRAAYWTVEIDGPGANTVSFPGVTWDGGTAPTIQSGTKQTLLAFRTRNAGAKIIGAASFGNIT